MSDIAIRVDHVSKKYRIGVLRHDTLRDRLAHGVSSLLGRNGNNYVPDDELWALQDISFEVKHGEIVGIIGRNGAGKSTLLKILSRITEPTKGRTEVYGRVGSLLEVGTGFHPELTGRENIYLNSAILGMRRAEIERKFDEIVAFSGIEQFLDTPVKRYSSGMYVRLAFAVAAHLEPEVLIVDEVLAVGDVAFQQKCLGKMNEVSQTGRTVLLVSHNMAAIQSLCERAILLQQGHIALDGPTDETIRNYLSYLTTSAKDTFGDNPERGGDGRIRLISARALDESNQPSRHLVAGKAASFEFDYQNLAQVDRAEATFTIYNHFGVPVANFDMNLTNHVVEDLGTEGKFICYVPNLPFPIGQYRIDIGVHIDRRYTDMIPNALVFDVESSTFYKSGRTPGLKYGSCMVEHNWWHKSTKPVASINSAETDSLVE